MFGKTQTAGPRKCAHPACFCTVTDGKKYCSDHCQDSRKMTELNCQCRHDACEHPTA